MPPPTSGIPPNPALLGPQHTLVSDYRGCQITEVVGLQRLSDYRGCQITEVVRLQRLSDYRGCQITEVVRLQRMSDYRGCQIILCFLVQSDMVIVLPNIVGLDRILDYLRWWTTEVHCMPNAYFSGNTIRGKLIKIRSTKVSGLIWSK